MLLANPIDFNIKTIMVYCRPFDTSFSGTSRNYNFLEIQRIAYFWCTCIIVLHNFWVASERYRDLVVIYIITIGRYVLRGDNASCSCSLWRLGC